MKVNVLEILNPSSADPARFLNAASFYADLGYPVFPLVPGDKLPPKGSHGHLDATTDGVTIRAMWSACLPANIGIRTDGLLVVDVDGANNPWLLDDQKQFNSLLTGPMQMTPHEGRHHFFRQPHGKAWSKTESQLAAKVDTRANGSYVIVAPSTLKDGLAYRWTTARLLQCPPNELPEPPAWLAEKLDAIETARTYRHEQPGDLGSDPIHYHTRNSTLTSIAGSLRRTGLSAEAMEAALQTINLQRCVPPLDRREVTKIAKSVARYLPDQISAAMAEGEIYLGLNGDGVANEPVHPGAFPPELFHVPGLMGEIIDHNLETAHVRQPILALSSAMALMSAITGRKIQDEQWTHTNLYVVALCPSGEGKEHGRSINKKILQLSAWEALIGPESFASSAGIVSAVEAQPVTLFQVDEIGRLLKTVRDPRRSPHLYNIISVLLKLYSSAGKLYIGDAYADTRKVKKIEWPHACIYGTTVPKNFYDGLTIEDLEEGFAARVLLFEVEGEGQDNIDARPADPPESIIRQGTAWRDFVPGGNLESIHPQPITLTYTEDARRLLREFRVYCNEEKAKEDTSVRSLWTRCTENAQKCALIYAASETGPDVREVSLDAVTWAITLIKYLTKKLIFSAMANVGSTDLELVTKNMLNKIRGTERRGLTRTEIYWLFKGHPQRRRAEMLQTLLDCGHVVPVTRSPNGRKVTAYVHYTFLTDNDIGGRNA